MNTKVIPILAVLLVIVSFLAGSMYTRIRNMEQKPADKIKAGTAEVTVAPKDVKQVLAKFAQDLSLNEDQFNQCVESEKYGDEVEADIKLGQDVGVSGTPTFYINGQQLVGAQPYTAFQAVINGEAPTTAKGEKPVILTAAQKELVESGGAAQKGNKDGSITIAEFSEYECPFCQRYVQQTYSQLWQEYGDKLNYIFHDFPLGFHAHAKTMANAARCAGEQDKYWEMHDMIFANRDQWAD